MRRNLERVYLAIATTLLFLIATNAGAETNGAPSALERRVFDLTNAERAEMGIAPLRWDDRLGRAAQGHAANMAATNRFAHTLDRKDPGARIRAQGLSPMRWSENIYFGGSQYGTPEAAVEAWMDSRGHRLNLLDRNVTILGVGVRKNARGYYYFVQNFARP